MKDTKHGQIIKTILFAVYGLLLIWVVIFKLKFDPADLAHPRKLNLIPFLYEQAVGKEVPIFDALANVIAFIPLGIYLSLFAVSITKTTAVGFGVSLIFEASQYIFAVGTSDITDLITNTAGTFLGVLIFKAIVKSVKDREKAEKYLLSPALICTAGAVAFFVTRLVMFLFGKN